MANEGYHEPIEELSDETRETHRAITFADGRTRRRRLVLEWIRRKDPRFDKELKDFLFTDKPIAHE